MSLPQPAKITREFAETEPVRFQSTGTLLLAGLRKHYTTETRSRIPELWNEVGPQLEKLSAQLGDAYGICTSSAGSLAEIDYMAACEVADVRNLPEHWTHVKILKQCYAVFAHDGHVSELNATVRGILERWLPDSGYEVASDKRDIPDFLEHYGKDYDPKTARGDIEVWLPLKT